jgi:hypothetical protein
MVVKKSRFITQLEVEQRPNHTLTHEIYNANVPDSAYLPMSVESRHWLWSV